MPEKNIFCQRLVCFFFLVFFFVIQFFVPKIEVFCFSPRPVEMFLLVLSRRILVGSKRKNKFSFFFFDLGQFWKRKQSFFELCKPLSKDKKRYERKKENNFLQAFRNNEKKYFLHKHKNEKMQLYLGI